MNNYAEVKKKIKQSPTIYKVASYVRSSFYKAASIIPDDIFVKYQYKNRMGKSLDLKNPILFNEKLQWLKVNWRDDLATRCADKFAVREFIKDRIEDDILTPLYGVYERPEDINFDELPNEFVLKVTHGWGEIIVCRDKTKLDINQTIKQLKNDLKRSHYLSGREWVYKNIPPRIVCEKYIDENGQSPKDYKIFCFNGKPQIIQVDIGRFVDHHRNIYDVNWRKLHLELTYKNSVEPLEKPKELDKMLYYAKKLSAEFPFVRTDFYHVNNKIYFGELTFYPENGNGVFKPEFYNRELGGLLKLPK